MVVVDASVAVEVLLRTSLGQRIVSNVLHQPRHAPHLIDVECAHALRRLVREKGLHKDLAEVALQNMIAWDLERHSHVPLLSRIWELRDSVTSYDASYIALAETLGATLLTCDGRLTRSHGHRAKIVLLS
ncbi:MAG TPA: type II toxin-antitoxin system VapC family toxin [Rhizomicrobium sp.]|jgi:predicted nucleic acid-binding protein|nr:type II toxin-antitoxin system VapC family toxin [Rhizomicrobium sp.]